MLLELLFQSSFSFFLSFFFGSFVLFLPFEGGGRRRGVGRETT